MLHSGVQDGVFIRKDMQERLIVLLHIIFDFGSRNVASLALLLIYRSELQCWDTVDCRTRASHNN